MVNQQTPLAQPRRSRLQPIADAIAPGSVVRDEQAFGQYLVQRSIEMSQETGEPPESIFNRLLDTAGRAVGAAGRGARGAGRFVEENTRGVTRPALDLLGQAGQATDPANPNLDSQQRGASRALRLAGQTADEVSAASAGAVTETIVAPVASGRAYGQDPNQFDQYLNDIARNRQQNTVLEALTLQAQRDAFRRDENINPLIKLGIEATTDVTNFVPAGRALRGIGLADNAARPAAGRVQDIVQTGSRPVANAADRGAALAERSAARQAANARPSIPFGPNRTKDGIPGGIPAGAADETIDPIEQEVRALRAQRQPAAQQQVERQLSLLDEADAPEPVKRIAAEQRVERELAVDFQARRVVEDLTNQIREARPVSRAEREAIIAEGRRNQVREGARVLEQGTGQSAFNQAQAALAGEITPRFTPPVISGEDAYYLYESIRLKPDLRFFTRINTRKALDKLLVGLDPSTSELILLEKQFGRDLIEAFSRSRERGIGKASTLVRDILGVPKTLRSAFDLSAPLRQGLLLGPRNPREYGAAWRDMFRSFSRAQARQINEEILTDPDIEFMIGRGLFMQNVEEAGPAALRQLDEQFISRLANKIPGVGVSERTYGTFLNKLKHDVAKKHINNWRKQGLLPNEALNNADLSADMIQRIDSLSRAMNVLTGRGTVPQKLQAATDVLNVAFWSPRLAISRFEAPTLLLDGNVRRLAAENLAATIGLGATMLAIAEAAIPGAKVEKDPRSSDFGKLRVGETRLDPWGGMQQIARYTAQIATNQTKNSDTGEVYTPYGTNRASRAGRFLRSKASPGLATVILNELTGSTFLDSPLEAPPDRGRPPENVGGFLRGNTAEPVSRVTGLVGIRDINPLNRATSGGLESAREQEGVLQLAPLFGLEYIDAMENYGLFGGTALSLPTLFGVGTQTYNPPLNGQQPGRTNGSGEAPPIRLIPSR